VGQCRVGAEPGEHVAARQRGEVAQGVQAQPAQQVGQLGPFQRLDVDAGEELPRAAGRHEPPAPRGQPGGEDPVGDAHLALDRTGLRDVFHDPLGGPLFPAEIPDRPPRTERAGSRPHHLDPGDDLFHRRDHLLERPRVPTRIVLDDRHLGTAALRLALAQPPAHALGPGRLGARDHPVGVEHRDGRLRRDALDDLGGDHRPVGAPDEECARRTHGFTLPSNTCSIKRHARTHRLARPRR
jgi:hypothetical protein